MRLVLDGAVRERRGDFVVRESAWGRTAVWALFALLGLAWCSAPLLAPGLGWLGWIVGAPCLLAAALMTSGVARGWRGKWWLVIVRDDALIVRLRSRLNADLPSEWANVLVIEREHVRSIAARRASLRLPDEDLGPSAPRTWLELELDADAPPAIARAIDREASPGIRGRTHFHAPIASLAAPARLRVHFGGGSAAMRPGLRTTLRALSKARYPVDDHVQCETHDWRAMGADERDAMIDALLARGERIQAVKLWRDAHGGGLAEALDALRAREQRRSA